MTSTKESPSSYSQFACIGAGFSGIALGATLKRWYGITDVRFFERHSDLGGTWYANKYPGAACDVPSVLYSYSFEPNPNWSRVLPSQEELWKYQKHVADKYGLPSKMTFGVEVQKCQWIEERKRWVLDVRDYKTDVMFQHECRFLFAGSGILVTPREIDIPGSENFKGSIFHTSQWRSDVDVKDKNVVVIGNGCTAAQIVPSIVDKTKHLTQIVRAKHWMLPPIDGVYTDCMKSIFKYLPGTMMIQRLLIFLFAEIELKAVPMTTSAAKFRQKQRAYAEKFMRDTAPAKYHDLLIPDFEIGCKRRIYDSGYLKSLHSKNLTLTNERALKIVENGVETDRGFIEADVIVLANGFSTNTFLEGVEVVGRDETLTQHWESFGGAEAYNCSAMSGFPNFFMLLGPNATTGHTSAIMAIENSVNFALRILKPVLGSPNGVIELDRDAEVRYVNRIQDDLSKTVWNSGCQSWYIQPHSENSRVWNAMVYPYSQGYLWYRSLFPVWRDWRITPLYRYDQLPANSIRLLRLLPHQDERAPITCQLFNCVLENSGSCRPYEALSYVWGSNHKPESILIDGCDLPIGKNLFAALLHLRDRSIERILWIDAICINQQDTKEKGHQVQSIAKIYASATRVIVWLGKATVGIDQSLEVIRIAGFAGKQPTITQTNENSILEIVRAPWFQRIWVLQEVAAARHIVVKCGHAEIDGDRRDKIYALLGMCSDDPTNSNLVVNYNTPWVTVFQQVVNFILGSASSVETWDSRELAVIRIRGCVLGQVSSFYRDLDREGKQSVRIGWNCEYTKKELSSDLELLDQLCEQNGFDPPQGIEALHPLHLAAAFLDGGNQCCGVFTDLFQILSPTFAFYRNIDGHGHTILDALIVTVLRSHTSIQPGDVSYGFHSPNRFPGEENDICGRWDAEAPIVRELFEQGYARIPTRWKHPFCHTAVQAVCHSIIAIFASPASPNIDTPSGLFVRRCTTCGLELKLGPIHTLVIVAFYLAQLGMPGETLFGALAMLTCLTALGADVTTKANISVEGILRSSDGGECRHTLLSPLELMKAIPEGVIEAWSECCQIGWGCLTEVLVLVASERDQERGSRSQASVGPVGDEWSGTPASSHSESSAHDSCWVIFQEECHDNWLKLPCNGPRIGLLWASIQTELLTYRRVRDGDSWISEKFSMKALNTWLKAEHTELSMPLVQNRIFKVHTRCGWFGKALEFLCPTAEDVCTKYFMNMEIDSKTSYIEQPDLLGSFESREQVEDEKQ
ncbi:ACB 4-hydroxyacetophenone monooxygenase [Fusarium subglutinans]|uniref:ACB 4-hydroxyacetophenone monooxygenase n=1 Tax=Gibberella subglutinans TaxID=42677 RepID=A0A8H5LDM1_GIBSU|nr:ACB 4-hydroxyacetophenone monooxygenase [Fusarium subglutinans]KAF5590999.1 ACB 4-hydroxyacetophenone monooxygenase [Fusarium subglutinans]